MLISLHIQDLTKERKMIYNEFMKSFWYRVKLCWRLERRSHVEFNYSIEYRDKTRDKLCSNRNFVRLLNILLPSTDKLLQYQKHQLLTKLIWSIVSRFMKTSRKIPKNIWILKRTEILIKILHKNLNFLLNFP